MQFVVGRSQGLLRFTPLRNVQTRTDITKEFAVRGKARRARVKNPPIYSIGPPQPVLHLETLLRIKVAGVDFDAAIVIIWMDSSHPTVSQLLGHGPAGKVQPSLVKV